MSGSLDGVIVTQPVAGEAPGSGGCPSGTLGCVIRTPRGAPNLKGPLNLPVVLRGWTNLGVSE